MSLVGDLVATLRLDSSGFAAGAKRAQVEAGRLSTKLASTLASSVAGFFNPITAGLTGLVSSSFALDSMIRSAREAQQTELRLAAILKATGNAAGFSAEQLGAYASELQVVTNFGDDETKAAMALLATNTNITGQAFKDATRLAQDLAVAMDTDLNAAIRLVGKALADPERGLTALRRAGIQFTAAEEDKIKALVKSNDLLAAQSIVLSKLEGRVGGAAAATAEPVTQLANDLGDLGEAMGTPLLNAMNNTVSGLYRLRSIVQGLSADLSSAVPQWLQVAVVGTAVGSLGIGGTAIAKANQSGLFEKPENPAAAVAPLPEIDTQELDEKSTAVDRIADALRSARMQLMEAGGASHAQQIAAFADLGATEPQVSQMQHLLRMIDETKKRVAHEQASKSFFEQLQDDIDLASGAASEMDIKLRELQRQGFNNEELSRAQEMFQQLEDERAITERLKKEEEDSRSKASGTSESVAAAVAGSREAVSAIARSSNDSNKALAVAKQQVKEQEKTNDQLARLPDQLGKSLNLQVASIV